MSKLIKKLFLFVSCLIIIGILFSCMQGTDIDNTNPEEEHPVINTPETEQIYYSLILDSYNNENADSIIEIIMEITKLESEDAKDLIEFLPVILKTNIPENEIDIIIKNLEISGAKARKKISDKIIENFTYTVTLESFAADKKIPVIKAVREITGLGLGESKALVEGAPKTLRTEVSKADADDIISKIEAAGGKASKTYK